MSLKSMTIHSNKECLGRLRRHLSLKVSLPCAPVSAVALTALWPKQLMKEFIFCYGSRRLRVHPERKPWQQQDIDSNRELKAYISKCRHQAENNQEVGKGCKCSRPAPSDTLPPARLYLPKALQAPPTPK